MEDTGGVSLPSGAPWIENRPRPHRIAIKNNLIFIMNFFDDLSSAKLDIKNGSDRISKPFSFGNIGLFIPNNQPFTINKTNKFGNLYNLL